MTRSRGIHGRGVRLIEAAVRDRPRTGCWTDWPYGFKGRYPSTGAAGKAAHVALVADGRPRPPFPGDRSLHSCDTPECWNPDHLRWGTQGENVADRVARGRTVMPPAAGEANPAAKLTARSVRMIRQRRATGATVPELAASFSVSRRTIRDVCSCRTWATVDG